MPASVKQGIQGVRSSRMDGMVARVSLSGNWNLNGVHAYGSVNLQTSGHLRGEGTHPDHLSGSGNTHRQR